MSEDFDDYTPGTWVEELGEDLCNATGEDLDDYTHTITGVMGSQLGHRAERQIKAMLPYVCGATYTAEQEARFALIANVLGVQRGSPMSIFAAGGGHSNPMRDGENCAACVVAHELRLAGFNVAARAYDHTPGSVSQRLSANTRLAWRTAKGEMPQFTAVLNSSDKNFIGKIDKITAPMGSRYTVGWDYLRQDFGHIITATRTPEGLFFYDPQINNFDTLGSLASTIKHPARVEVLRVDRLLLDVELLEGVIMAL